MRKLHTALLLAALLPALAFAQTTGNNGAGGGGGLSRSGTVTTGNCAKWISNTQVADAGGPCGGTGAPGGTSGQIQVNSAGSFGGVSTTGAGNVVLATSATLVTPALGTPSAAVLTNATGLPISTGLTGMGVGVAIFLATPTSANLAAALSDETGSGAAVFATSPSLVTPNIGAATASGLTLSGITGLTQCLHVNSSGTVSGTGSDCGSGGSTGFGSLTTGSNTSATMTVGTGGTLTFSGSGVVNASEIVGLAWPSLVASDCLTNNGTTLSWASCGSGGGAFSGLTTGTNTSATMTVGTGATLTFSGSGVVNADEVNGATVATSAAVLASNSSGQLVAGTTLPVDVNGTGITGGGTSLNFENSSATNGVTLSFSNPSLDDIRLGISGTLTAAGGGTGCAGLTGTASSTTFIRGDCAWATPSGGGNVSTTGTPASGNLTKFSGATTVTNGDLSGDVTTSGTLAATVVQIEGGAIPTSAPLTGTNSSKQFVSVTTLPTSTMPALTGDLTGTGGSLSVTVSKVNGVNPGVTTLTSGTSGTPDCTFAVNRVTVSTGTAFTINAPATCTPYDGQELKIEITSSASGAAAYTFNSTFIASSSTALPTAGTAASKQDVLKFEYDSTSACCSSTHHWKFLAMNQGF